jgi:transcriptional regulator with XRE-family HTH domain
MLAAEPLTVYGCHADMDIIPFSPARVMEERKNKRLTQADLAQLAKISQSAVSQIEKGLINPREIQLRALGRALGVLFVADWQNDGWEMETPYFLKGQQGA